ncbi:MAG TPA: zinc metallopeptidase [Anaerolineales bacterium]|nr:zinc metallopeptidase [Anaerolineales bacterium]
MLFYNPTYFLYMLPALLLMMAAQWYVSSVYRKWSQVPNRSRLSGAEAAQRLIRNGGLYEVEVEGVAGNLSDHYDPRKKVLRLSRGVHQGRSVAAVAIAAHELGHAMQDQEGYALLRLRSALVPAVNIGSTLGWILIILGLVLRMSGLAWLGVLVFAAGAVFALATLPVELNASARAKQMLLQTGIVVGEDEQRGVNNVLNAAAMTYIAALATAVLQLLYYVSLVGGMGGRRR